MDFLHIYANLNSILTGFGSHMLSASHVIEGENTATLSLNFNIELL
jgi:hypothetical protein